MVHRYQARLHLCISIPIEFSAAGRLQGGKLNAVAASLQHFQPCSFDIAGQCVREAVRGYGAVFIGGLGVVLVRNGLIGEVRHTVQRHLDPSVFSELSPLSESKQNGCKDGEGKERNGNVSGRK